jgi:hypothetical protein
MPLLHSDGLGGLVSWLSLAKMLSGANAFRISGHKFKNQHQYPIVLHVCGRRNIEFASHKILGPNIFRPGRSPSHNRRGLRAWYSKSRMILNHKAWGTSAPAAFIGCLLALRNQFVREMQA